MWSCHREVPHGEFTVIQHTYNIAHYHRSGTNIIPDWLDKEIKNTKNNIYEK